MTDTIDIDQESKQRDLQPFEESAEGQYLTSNQGLRIQHTDDSLKAGDRGPTLLEDFHFREKITHFDHERIPERVVHARGAGAHGYFQVYEPQTKLTKAKFLQDPSVKTPVFVRFSTVAGSRGSADTVRDVRGFATKFYTEEGVFDLVGNNIPVFFIQDAIKFPDLVHAVKAEPDNEMPQAATAHDTAWDFFSLLPEATHMVMWVLSDRALPRSFRMMEGFGIHTFRLVDESGASHFVKWHWKPVLGAHSLVWDEAQQIAGKDPDYLRRDLWEAIEQGNYPEYELGLQVLEEADEFKFPFDLLDPTKIWPEELVPVQRIGKMTLNRNPENFFAETEQVAFHPGHVVPGIDFSNDPLLQGRLFSYIDTQITRLGGPNFAQIPINRPVAPVHNNQRDGHMQMMINQGKGGYYPNSIAGGCPMLAPETAGGYVSYPAAVQGPKVRARGENFHDYFSQATLFWKSLTPPEQDHLVEAAQFELGKVDRPQIRERMLGLFTHVDSTLATRIAEGIGVTVPTNGQRPGVQPPSGRPMVDSSAALSLENGPKGVKTRKVAILAGNGVDEQQVQAITSGLEAEGVTVEVIGKGLGVLNGANGGEVPITRSALTAASVLYDAVIVPGGTESAQALSQQGEVRRFVAEAFKHAKTIGALGEGARVLAASDVPIPVPDGTAAAGVVVAADGVPADRFVREFTAALSLHRHWNRNTDLVPA